MQHYMPHKFFEDSFAWRIEKDLAKKKVCDEFGLSLVCIPFWWEKDANSLLATLQLVFNG
jgi:hypothetical protein